MDDHLSPVEGEAAAVRFTVKELLARIDARLEEVSHKLDLKVDRPEFEHLQQEVRSLLTWRSRVTGALTLAAFFLPLFFSLLVLWATGKL